MDFTQHFAPITNHKSVTHPGGAEFRIYPWTHPDAWQVLVRKMPLKRIERFERWLAATSSAKEKGEDLPLLSEFFETGEEMIEVETHMAAAHLALWSGLTSGKTSIPFSYEKAVELMRDAPAFMQWVIKEAQALADEHKDVAEKADETGNA